MTTKFIKTHNYVYEYQQSKFIWGTHDCCTFTCGLVKALTDKDPLKDMGLEYSNKVQALKVIKQLGGLEKAADDFIGEPLILALAKLGDIVLGDLSEGETLGICMGGFSVFLTENGVTHLPTLSLKKAWRF